MNGIEIVQPTEPFRISTVNFGNNPCMLTDGHVVGPENYPLFFVVF